ncbi:chloramphenicol phosphotransferase [Ensifer sp. Root31]|uniref:chloramphenicol phosphotransferase n=1 Tax=Ensifer sp. Root31 TaxID=1736512 RepID=UPI00070F0E1E|nr:chloramphenicol phosphotransferase [Ensifer sp. Root31]KQU96099.1 chloramphenicol phosphotransferase [Ensifer sp. Root31]
MRVFVLLMGFPGVGKLTIANELSTLVSAKVIDNHWFNNPIFRLLDDDGITPLPNGISEYTGRIRQVVLDAIVAYSPTSASFIFTQALVEGNQGSIRTFEQVAGAAQQSSASLIPIRLLCDEDELARRVSTPTRREQLKSIDTRASRQRSRKARVFDPQHPFTKDLDVTSKSAKASAAAIQQHVIRVIGGDFGPPRTTSFVTLS